MLILACIIPNLETEKTTRGIRKTRNTRNIYLDITIIFINFAVK